MYFVVHPLHTYLFNFLYYPFQWFLSIFIYKIKTNTLQILQQGRNKRNEHERIERSRGKVNSIGVVNKQKKRRRSKNKRGAIMVERAECVRFRKRRDRIINFYTAVRCTIAAGNWPVVFFLADRRIPGENWPEQESERLRDPRFYVFRSREFYLKIRIGWRDSPRLDSRFEDRNCDAMHGRQRGGYGEFERGLPPSIHAMPMQISRVEQRSALLPRSIALFICAPRRGTKFPAEILRHQMQNTNIRYVKVREYPLMIITITGNITAILIAV